MMRPQHHLFNIPRGYYYFQLPTLSCLLKFLVFHTDSSQASQSKMVLGSPSVSLSSLFVLVSFPKGFAYACIENNCLCVEQMRLIDCSRVGVESTRQTKKTMAN